MGAIKPNMVNQLATPAKPITTQQPMGNPFGNAMLNPASRPLPPMAGKSAVTNMPTSPMMLGNSQLGALAAQKQQQQMQQFPMTFTGIPRQPAPMAFGNLTPPNKPTIKMGGIK